jgi:hypothetical protein
VISDESKTVKISAMKIETHIRNIRPELDVEQPDEDLIWMGISQSFKNHAKQKRIHYWRYALLAAAMIIFAFMAGYHVTKKSEQHLIFVNLDPKLAKQEAKLVHLIKNYTRQIERENFDLETLPTTPADLKDMDRLIEAYSADLRQYGANPELIRTLLDLYEKKIMLLNRMLNEIKKEKEYENNQFVF